ncbi:hypothetical protein Patl_0329 [Paraglaciecola sp. T6c]|uniref:hypothetical protein n=1 Tax=Pseudoalteromonas atlantica (strain T6c / ATCC BAA-1087) TaxID=3042615 RepID=UPI00005C5A2F|nr:hypothetical protein [Paraglaciecola sp. T6c]ABG38860.1 hypothetical protein Patl_0329 [Paraglaciecola sp. T6c]
MSIDTLSEIRNSVYASKYLSRAALLVKNNKYPFRDEENVFRFTENYLKEAIEGKKYFSKEKVDYSHLASLQPARDLNSVSDLESFIKSASGNKNNKDFILELLNLSYDVLKEKHNHSEIGQDKAELASKFLKALADIQSSKADEKLFDTNTDRRTEYNLAI